MSLKTFLSKLFGGLKKEIKALPLQIRNGLHIGITVVEGLKKAIDSPVADILTAIIPGEWDDKLKNLIRAKLPAILTEMKLVEQCAGETDPNEIIRCALTEIEKLVGDDIKGAARVNFLDSIAVMIAQVSADGKLSLDDAKYLVKPYYDLIYKPKK
jgi:hypothetical protein